jgi:biopolymer transport protein ExbD
VSDWIQQGRLLPEDRARPAGKGSWYALSAIPALAPYFPRPEPHRAEDQAEALERVEVGFSWKRRHRSEEDDPDMIPLIDVSLVLLVFFMMTAAIQTGLFSPIDTPQARHQLASLDEGFWVGVDKDGDGNPRYSLGKKDRQLEPPGPSMAEITRRLKKELQDVSPGEVRVRIRGDRRLAYPVIEGVILDLQGVEREINTGRGETKERRVNLLIYGEVSEPSGER